MGPDELKAAATESEQARAAVDAERRRRWDSFKEIPKTPFKSILDWSRRARRPLTESP
jgi:hypothetical protein